MKRMLLTLFGLLFLSQAASAEGLALQCENPRKDVFIYKDGKAVVSENFSDGTMRPSEFKLIGFDPLALKAVMSTTSGAGGEFGMIVVFEIDFANPAVKEHRIGTLVSKKFSFDKCRRLN